MIKCNVMLVRTGGSFILHTCGSCPVWLLTYQHPTPSFETLYMRSAFSSAHHLLVSYVSADRIDCRVMQSLQNRVGFISSFIGICQVSLTFSGCLKRFQERTVLVLVLVSTYGGFQCICPHNTRLDDVFAVGSKFACYKPSISRPVAHHNQDMAVYCVFSSDDHCTYSTTN